MTALSGSFYKAGFRIFSTLTPSRRFPNELVRQLVERR
jgi:hypothetical protein